MKFRTELHLQKSDIHIGYSDRLLLLGSCFSENIGQKLNQIKYLTTVNPLGIVYHPVPLHESIKDALSGKVIEESNLNRNIDGQYTAWNIHSRLSTVDAQESMNQMNDGLEQLKGSLQGANFLILTYGTAYYYDHKDYGPVANCHKFPSKDFVKKLSSTNELIYSFDRMLTSLKTVNPNIKVLLTVSPVRHIKDGIIENNRSKAHLISAVHEICDNNSHCHYLPSYELLIDDLRDYRYYADDMVHPSDQAIEYIWSKIGEHILAPSEATLRSDILKLIRAAAHRPFNAKSQQHMTFLNTQRELTNKILKTYPNLDFSKELEVFEI